MAPRGGKRKHDGAGSGTGGGATVCDETRILDPYALQLPACRLVDHHRKKSKSAAALRNCAENPNCLFGLGEHQEGVWAKPKLVQRLLGDDPREQLRAVYPDAPRRKNSASSSPAAESGASLLPCGLRNLGATCYLNSMLQTLFTNVAFREAVYRWEPKPPGASDELALQMRALQKLFGLMQLGKRAVYDPNEFADTLALNSVVQQDVQEFSKLLLTHLRMIFSQSRISDHWDLVDRLFQGQMSYVTKCLRCKTRSERPSSYYEISLNIKGHKTVQACLESYLSAEVLDGENKYFCDTCDSKERAERYIELNPKRLPQTITLQLMRFVYDAHEGRKKKLMDVIEVNETLNMTELLRRCGLADAFSETNDAIYRLSGYLNHRGKSTHAGHYTASVAHPKPDDTSSVDWFEFDDNVVNNMATIVDTEGSKERHGKILRSRDAYMLLYVRDDSAGVAAGSSSTLASLLPPRATVAPSKDCLDEIVTLNAVFESDVQTYVEKAEALEARIQARLDAYNRFFEKEQPSPKPDADDFYWVETSWLRAWIVGEEVQQQPLSKDATKKNDHPEQATPNGAQKENSDGDDEQSKKPTRDAVSQDSVVSNDSSGSNGVAADSKHNVLTTTTVHTVNVDEIPFSKPIDVNRFCCVHSVDVDTPKVSTHHHHHRLGFKLASFAPENVSKLKRVSANLFEYLRETCGIAPNAQPRSPTLEGRRSRRTSDQSDVGAVFGATSFRCRDCEAEFCNRLLDDAELLRDVEHDLQLLKSTVSPDEPSPYLISRAWIASYKTHLQSLRKKILHKSQTKKPKKTESAQAAADSTEHSVAARDTVASDAVLQNALNADISCVHGNLTTAKKKYRSVTAATWLHFRGKFPRYYAFPERTAKPCAQCQIDDAVCEEYVQVERACRDVVLNRAPLQRLYRRKAPESGDVFSFRDAFAPPGPVNATVAAALAKKRMFLVPRSWLRKWREYIKNVEAEAPPALTSSEFMCAHNQLLLPQTLLSSLKGAHVNANSVPLEFVYPDEMQHLCELYGVPHCAYYFGLLQADDAVVWRSCTLETMGDDNDDTAARANCSECEQLSEIQHLDAIQNFEHGVVQVRLLGDDQAVPTEERPLEASAAGRQRRSKRIRSGGANWSIFANASDSVYVLKTKIFEEVDAYPIRQRLYFRGRVLEDRASLKDCGIKAGDTVYMRLSEEMPDETSMGDDGFEREVGFEDSVFLRHTVGIGGSGGEFRAGGSDSRVWVCAACTYVNDEVDPACEMCTTERTIEID